MRNWKRTRMWTPEEEAALRAGVLKHGTGRWKDILTDSEFNPILSNRSNINLQIKWRDIIVRRGRRKWTSEEEAALRAGVLKHGIGGWKEILKDSEFNPILSNRSNIQLKDKWRNISAAGDQGERRRWTSEEEAALRAGVLKHGIGGWKAILKDSKFNPILSNRSNIDLKDKWRNMSASSDQGGCRKKSRMRKPKAANSDGLSPAAQLPTEQTSTARPPVDDSFKDDDDYINELPEEILVFILCFMSTKEAIRTSLVSWRWKNLWMKVPKLEFSCWQYKEFRELCRPPNFKMYEYVNLVNQVVKLHDTTTLEELTICFPSDSNYSNCINRWVEFAARKQVKKVELDFCTKSSRRTTPCYKKFLPSLAAIRLCWLKDLYLKGINVDDKVIECLFSNSPFIERLSVIDSQDLHYFVVADAPNLKYLELSNCHCLRRLDISAPNLNIIKLHLYLSLVSASISAPALSLVSMSFYHVTSAFYHFPVYGTREILECLQNLLGQFRHVNKILKLTVSCEVWYGICKLIDISHWPPELSKVEDLKITIIKPNHLWHRYINEPHPSKWAHGHLWPCAMVKRAPFLRKLLINLFHLDYILSERTVDAKWKEEDIVEKVKALTNVNGHYSHQHLKVVELDGFTGCVNEVELVLYLVEIAPSLEKIIIHLAIQNETLMEKGKEYDYMDFCEECAEVLKTLIRPHIDVEILAIC